MINLDTYTNYCTEKCNDDEFFLFRNDYSIIERFGLWGAMGSDIDAQRTKQTIYHNDNDGTVVSGEEGIEIVWQRNPLGLIREDDYYKKIK